MKQIAMKELIATFRGLQEYITENPEQADVVFDTALDAVIRGLTVMSWDLPLVFVENVYDDDDDSMFS